MTIVMRALVALLGAMTIAGCSDGKGTNAAPDAAVCAEFSVDSIASTTATRADIDTIFARACSFSTCHGTNPGSGRLYLPKKADGDWYPEVMKSAEHLKTMKRVAPGDPNNSFLLIKMDGHGLCFLAPTCNGDAGAQLVDGGSCGESMPQGSDRLPDTDVAKVAAWIRAGAPAN